MKLTAHPNVVDIAEERRQRQAADLTDEAARFHTLGGILFIGYRSAPVDSPPHHGRPRWLQAVLGWAKGSRAS
jgi:hypothetical protein